ERPRPEGRCPVQSLRSRWRLRGRRSDSIQRQIQLKHIHPRLAQQAELLALRMPGNQAFDCFASYAARMRHAINLDGSGLRTDVRVDAAAGLCDQIARNG